MSTELALIFDDTVIQTKQEPCLYDDSLAYMQGQKSKKKPLPPSQQAIVNYYNGSDKSLNQIATTFFARSLLIGTALALFGDNKGKNSVIQNSLVASASIEVFLMYWYKVKNK